jgi:glycosyltransferase involved in cell wall biosynthesis
VKIAIITYSLHVGGAERFIFNISRFFLKEGHFVEVIEAENEGEWKSYFAGNGINVRTCPINLSTIPFLHTRKLGGILKKFDIVILIDIPFAQAALGLLKDDTVSIPVIELSIPSMYKNAISNKGQWNNIVAVSEQIKCILLKDYKIDPASVRVIPNAIETVDYPRKDFNFENGIKFIYVGRIEDNQKGIMLLPDIVKGLIIKYPKVELTIIGDGPDLQSLKGKADNYELTEKIHFEGSLTNEQVIERLKECHFLLMPSNQEGLPFVLLEAMMVGVIPVASYLPGITDMVIEEWKNGYFAVPGDYETFVSASLKAIENNKNLEAISQRCHKTIVENFSTDIIGHKYLDLINSLLSHRSLRSKKVDIELLKSQYKHPYYPILMNKILSKVF